MINYVQVLIELEAYRDKGSIEISVLKEMLEKINTQSEVIIDHVIGWHPEHLAIYLREEDIGEECGELEICCENISVVEGLHVATKHILQEYYTKELAKLK